MNFKKARKSKTSEKQFDLLLDFMSAHKILITGKLQPGEGPQKIQQMWEEVTTILNSAGTGPAKSVDGWKKTWNEYKCNTKKRAREIKLGLKQTGGGEAKVKQLSDRDQRLLGLFSRVAVDGLENVIEPGLPGTNTPPVAETVAPEDIITEAEVVITSDVVAVEHQSEASPIPPQKRKRSPEQSTSAAKRRRVSQRNCKSSAAERATAAYAEAMQGRNVELAKNTAVIKELASAMREVATAIEAMANSILSLNN